MSRDEQIMCNNLMVLSQVFATAKGWALTTVSKKIHGDQKFLERFLAGKGSTTLKTYFLMVDRLRAEWPAGTKWPQTARVPNLSRMVVVDREMPPRQASTGKFLGKSRKSQGTKVHKRVRK